MKRTLHEHIVYLEQTMQSLRDELTRPNLSMADLKALGTELATAELAFAHYRKAYELEEQIAGGSPAPSTPQPQDSSPSDSNHDEHKRKDRSVSHYHRRPLAARDRLKRLHGSRAYADRGPDFRPATCQSVCRLIEVRVDSIGKGESYMDSVMGAGYWKELYASGESAARWKSRLLFPF